jgi:hypothetical protein
MTVLRLMLLIGLVALTAICRQNSAKRALVPPASCRVTVAPANTFMPPASYKLDDDALGFWWGTEKLWIELPKSGVWEGWRGPEPGQGPRSGPLTSKTTWWSVDYDRRREGPDLKVTGRRLDGDAPPILASEAHDVYIAMMVGIYLPTPGCWEITGEYKGQKLSFVVWVTPELVRPDK